MLLNPPKHDLKTPASQTERVCVSVGSETHPKRDSGISSHYQCWCEINMSSVLLFLLRIH